MRERWMVLKKPFTLRGSIRWCSLFYWVAFILIVMGLNFPLQARPVPSFYIEALAGSGILILTLTSVRLRRARWRWFLWIVACGLGIIALQQALGVLYLASDALLLSLFVFYIGLLAWAAASMTAEERLAFCKSLFTALIVAWCLGFLLQLSQWLVTHISRPSGYLGQPNHFATWTVLSACAALWLQATNRWPGAITPVIHLAASLSLALAASRTAYLVLLLCLLWTVYTRHASRHDPTARTAANVYLKQYAFLALATFLLVSVRPLIEHAIFGASNAPDNIMRPASDHARIHFLLFAWHAALAKPLLGWGIYQMPLVVLYSEDDGQGSPGILPSAHNLFADLIVWLGLPIGISLGILISLAIYRALFSPGDTRLRLPLQTMVIALFVHAMLEYPLYYLMWLGIFTILVVILFAQPVQAAVDDTPGCKTRVPWHKNLANGVVLAVTIVVVTSYNALQERRFAYFLEGRCHIGHTLATTFWPRFAYELDYLCGTALPNGIRPLEVAALAHSPDTLLRLYFKAPNRYEQWQGLKANCRTGTLQSLQMPLYDGLSGPELCNQLKTKQPPNSK